MMTDIEIAQKAEMKHIREVAAKLGISEDDLDLYGKYKAKLSDELIKKVEGNEKAYPRYSHQSNTCRRGKDDNHCRTW